MNAPTISFTKSDLKAENYYFEYCKVLPDGTQIECSGGMQAYHSGRDIEHVIAFGWSNDELSDIVDRQDREGNTDCIYNTIENEIYQAFYNQVKI